jgi:Ala-tRNA(Pro) deacylase
MEIPNKLIELLDQNEIAYEVLHHEAAFTAQRIAEAEHIKGGHQAKVVMVKCGDQHLMVIVPADRRIDFEKLEKIAGQPVSLDKEPEFRSLFPDCALGTMPPFGNLYGLPTYVDKTLAKQDYIVFEAGTYTDAIKLSYLDYARIAQPRVEDLTINRTLAAEAS